MEATPGKPGRSPAGGLRLFLVGLCGLSLWGCRLGPAVPEWIDHPPFDQDHLFALGSFIGALYPEDNRKYALQDAISNLSAQMVARVEEELTIRSSGGDPEVRRKAKIIADNAVKNVQPIHWWTDEEGAVKFGQPGTVYVLVRAPMPKL